MTTSVTPGPPWPVSAFPALSAFYATPPHPTEISTPAFVRLLDGWESENLVALVPPYPMVAAWRVDQPLRVIRCHRLVAPSLARVLAGIRRLWPADHALRAAGLHLFGGCYAHRLVRGSRKTLSLHAYGAAIDLDPDHNGLGCPPARAAMPGAVVALFEAEGWTWGGRFSRPDPMHFQATSLRTA